MYWFCKAEEKIKNIKLIRKLFKPYMDYKLKRAHDYYLRTPDSWYLKTLKGIHTGERCFIIGNGPSLKAGDLDKLKGEYTFACNRIFNIFSQTDWRPTYYLAMDDRVVREVQSKLKDYELGHVFLSYKFCNLEPESQNLTKVYDSYFLVFDVNKEKHKYDDKTSYISEDISNHFCNGSTVTFWAIQLAIYMGFSEIYLLGVDHHYSTMRDASGKLMVDPNAQDYFDNKRYSARSDAPYYSVQYSFEVAREYCGRHGIKIFNATRGGRLEVFERINFDEVIAERSKG